MKPGDNVIVISDSAWRGRRGVIVRENGMRRRWMVDFDGDEVSFYEKELEIEKP